MIKIEKEEIIAKEHKKTIVLDFDKEDVEKATDTIEKKLAKEVEIKGFRKGKVPLEEAKKHLSKQQVLSEVVDLLSRKGYDFIVDKYYEENNKETKDFALDFFIENPNVTLNENKDKENISFTYSFELYPEVKIDINDLKNPVKKEDVTDEEIQKKINEQIDTHGSLELKEDGSLEKGDDAVFDFEGSIAGEKFDGGTAKGYELQIGSGHFIPGFEDQMIGMKAGEEKTIKVTFPKEYGAKNLAGKEADFLIKLIEIKKVVKPEYNDEFIKSLNIKDVTNDEQLRQYYKKELEAQKEVTYKNELNNAISQELEKNVKLNYIPETILKQQEEQLNNEFNSTLKQYNIDLEKFLEITKQTKQDIEANFKKEAEQRVKLDFAINQIAKDKDIKLTKEELEEEVKQLKEMYNPDNKPEINKNIDDNIAVIESSIIQKKVYAYLFDLLSKK